ncbi:hypothetical protein [Legionella bononiensis]|nr:hypothetical protein [Legionella bononiensis]
MSATNEMMIKDQWQIISDSLLKIAQLAENNTQVMGTLMLNIISSIGALAENTSQGASAALYSELEAFAKSKNPKNAANSANQSFTSTNIADDDYYSAMNYIGQNLVGTLFKSINELPAPLRTHEMLLSGIEGMLGNVLHQKFSTNAHEKLDGFYKHIRMHLNELGHRPIETV